jgi:hypothetical protein
MQVETVRDATTSLSKIKHRTARPAQKAVTNAEPQRGRDQFFLALLQSVREIKSAGKRLEDDKAKVELMRKVIGNYVVPQEDVLYVYRKAVRVLIDVLKLSQEDADRFTREMILKSVEMALAEGQCKP